MKLVCISLIILLQGCAAITRKNFIGLNKEQKESVDVYDSLVYADPYFEIKVFNRNSNRDYLTVGPLVPIIPIELFSRSIVPNNRFTVEFILTAKVGQNSDTILDFSSMTIEEPLTEDKKICWRQSAKQVDEYKEFNHDFLKANGLFSSGGKLYQIDCTLSKNSIPPSEGVFLKILDIKALNQKTKQSFDIPDLVFSYRSTYQYEFFSPQ